MDDRRGTNRLKRPVKIPQEGFWDCSVCTYKNPPEAFKCEICDVRKGTSTRKPRLNQELVAQQVAPQLFVPPMLIPKKERTSHHDKSHGSKEEQDIQEDGRPPKLRNIDRSTARHMEVTVDNVTVIITDYQPKSGSSDKDDSSDLDTNINSDSNDGLDRPTARELHEDSAPEDSRS